MQAAAQRGLEQLPVEVRAGRELRVIVEPTRLSDQDALLLARDISKAIEQQMEYPGAIKVTVIRETRCVEYAR